VKLPFEKMNPGDFQRLAVAALRHDLRDRARVIPYDPPHGVTDGGFDARVIGEIDGYSGTWRADAKRVPNYDRARQELRKVLNRHSDLPIVFVIAGRITDSERKKLVKLGTDNKPNVLISVKDGAWLDQVVAAHSWLEDWFFSDHRGAYLHPAPFGAPSNVDARYSLDSEITAATEAINALKTKAYIAIKNTPTSDAAQVLRTMQTRSTTLPRSTKQYGSDAIPMNNSALKFAVFWAQAPTEHYSSAPRPKSPAQHSTTRRVFI